MQFFTFALFFQRIFFKLFIILSLFLQKHLKNHEIHVNFMFIYKKTVNFTWLHYFDLFFLTIYTLKIIFSRATRTLF